MPDSFGPRLRQWRTARRLSQEGLAAAAEISTRHLSCLETSKAQPSREMVLLLTSALDLELRERNAMLATAGFAPVYPVSTLESLTMEPVRRAIALILAQQEPYGAMVVDRTWNILASNNATTRLISRFLPDPPADPRVTSNLARITLHPHGLRSAIANWPEVARFALDRLEHERTMYPLDAARSALMGEVLAYPGVAEIPHAPRASHPMAVVHLRRGREEARLFTMLTTLGTPLDVTAQELTIETWFPADEATATFLRGLA
jgi:transcriptional regulator with XRE-family HTH domain